MSEDDGYCYTIFILEERELDILYIELFDLMKYFTFKGNYRVEYERYRIYNRYFDEFFISLTDRGQTAPLINLKFKEKEISFDVN